MAWLRKGGFVYALKNPTTEKYYYVGQTIKSLKDRLQNHIWESKNRNYPRCLITQTITPEIVVLEDVTGETYGEISLNLDKSESYWIKKLLQEGHPLTNKKQIK